MYFLYDFSYFFKFDEFFEIWIKCINYATCNDILITVATWDVIIFLFFP